MNRRVGLMAATLGIVMLLPLLAAGAVGCGPKGGTTTTAPTQTGTTAAPAAASTAAVTTTTAAPAGLSLASETGTGLELQQYLTEMLAFGQALADLPVADDPSNFEDVSAITPAQLEAADKYVSGVQGAIALLKAIQPPAEVADAHQKVLAGIEALAAATDTLMTAAKDKDQAAFDAARDEGRAALQTLQASMEELLSLLGGALPSN
jgi:hypothetical protein